MAGHGSLLADRHTLRGPSIYRQESCCSWPAWQAEPAPATALEGTHQVNKPIAGAVFSQQTRYKLQWREQIPALRPEEQQHVPGRVGYWRLICHGCLQSMPREEHLPPLSKHRPENRINSPGEQAEQKLS